MNSYDCVHVVMKQGWMREDRQMMPSRDFKKSDSRDQYAKHFISSTFEPFDS